jgi:hypothetical protein
MLLRIGCLLTCVVGFSCTEPLDDEELVAEVTRPAVAQAHGMTSTAETIYYWNDVLLEAFRRQGGAPTTLSHAAAMVHTGRFDVLASVWLVKGEPLFYDAYSGIVSVDPIVDDDLAVGLAARDLLVAAFPAHQSFIQQRFVQRHGSASQPEAQQLAAAVVAAIDRSSDYSLPGPPYVLGGVPGAWRPTGNGCNAASDAVTPNWGAISPFTMPSSSAFRQPPPGGHTTYAGLLASSLYAGQFNEVKELGRSNSTTRTAAQTQIAWFWANDLDGTYKPPGQLLEHTRIVVEPLLEEPVKVSRVFALVSLAMADAGIAAWDEKYLTSIDLWRPQSAIREAHTDNNPATVQDLNWQPLSANRTGVHFSPCFPAWVSGHATFAAAWAGIMRSQFGDARRFTATTEDPHALGVVRTFTSFTAAAAENARSRIYLGVHYQFDADDGLRTGYAIADYARQNYLLPYF